ncbi:magnesium and cobalt transport protein CorA [Brachybacterium phenoliresistens]|uniref:magnesium and cobalt transport protein CorA n=1 Tax=Brachybacterium phenoliresistens TaxID=396014 RepID=UPI00337C6C3F
MPELPFSRIRRRRRRLEPDLITSAGTTDAPADAEDPRRETPAGSRAESSIVDSAVYVDGARIASPACLADSYRALRSQEDAVGWIGLYRPRQDDLASLAAEFDLHELAVEDAILAHQRPKIERYDDTLFVVLRAARYLDDVEEVEFGEVHLFVGPDFVLTVRHSESPDLSAVRRRLESNPELLRLGPEAILYAVLDRVVDGYAPVVAGLSNDIDEIETQVFLRDPGVSRRIYELSREVIEFERATKPLLAVLSSLGAGFQKYGTDEELQRYLRDVEDHLVQVVEHVSGFREMLRDILTVNATLVAQAQNEEMQKLSELSVAQGEEVKKISAWAAILFAPQIVGTVYGMNFDRMPELHWAYGYPFALVMMLAVAVALYAAFRRRGWI